MCCTVPRMSPNSSQGETHETPPVPRRGDHAVSSGLGAHHGHLRHGESANAGGDAAVNESRKVCKACTGAVAERAFSEDVSIRRRATWAQHLEREAIAAMPLRWTVSTSTVRTWDYTGTWGGQS